MQIIPGRVSTEVDARFSFDTQASVNKTLHIIELYELVDIPKERILIKIASTWESIQAAHILQFQHGMSCSLPLMFSPVQAIAGAVAGAFPTTPFVGCIYVYWVKMSSCPTTFGGKKKEGMNGG